MSQQLVAVNSNSETALGPFDSRGAAVTAILRWIIESDVILDQDYTLGDVDSLVTDEWELYTLEDAP